MQKVILTKDKVAIVDDEDFDLLNTYKWYTVELKTKSYAATSDHRRGVYTLMHRLLMNPGELVVDHIDGNGLNNQRSNLRTRSRSQNNVNSKPRQGRRYKGVTMNLNNRYNLYQAIIGVNKKLIYLGCFPTEELAALAYNRAAIKHYGEFATLNIV